MWLLVIVVLSVTVATVALFIRQINRRRDQERLAGDQRRREEKWQNYVANRPEPEVFAHFEPLLAHYTEYFGHDRQAKVDNHDFTPALDRLLLYVLERGIEDKARAVAIAGVFHHERSYQAEEFAMLGIGALCVSHRPPEWIAACVNGPAAWLQRYLTEAEESTATAEELTEELRALLNQYFPREEGW